MEENFITNPYKKEEKKSLAEVIISQIDACRIEFSKEMKEGFKHEQFVNGQKITVVVPDQRKTAINHTRTLYDLLLFFFDKEIKDNLKELIEARNKHDAKNMQFYLKVERMPRHREAAKLTGRFPKGELGGSCEDQALNIEVDYFRNVFQQLVLLFKRRRELSGKKTASYKD